MIIIRISGGLGNQMFQYCLGRNLSLKNKVGLVFDTSNYSSEKNRFFGLNNFNINGKEMTENDIKSIKIPNITDKSILGRFKRKTFRLIEVFKPISQKKFIIESDYTFSPEVLSIKNDNIYLSGIWQSEKYFTDISDIIRKEFSLKNKLSDNAIIFSNEIENSESVSIHIRRGDYINNQKTSAFHGTCSLDYYKEATNLIEKKVKNPKYFIFSDDVEWVKNNLMLSHPAVYVSGNNLPDYEEMILMSKCKHNIIANSSFSWWSAWLNDNPQKIVIAPKKWFNSDTNTKDLILESWLTI
ncbi:MAG: alpha-1,2-fucosyltransferase [Candidatus Pacebacteria bacterium]|nr:alpha-1,2-fucosyltransferase [Candidatus Paceibacterota bacterium]